MIPKGCYCCFLLFFSYNLQPFQKCENITDKNYVNSVWFYTFVDIVVMFLFESVLYSNGYGDDGGGSGCNRILYTNKSLKRKDKKRQFSFHLKYDMTITT